jgi:hypothetical protein
VEFELLNCPDPAGLDQSSDKYDNKDFIEALIAV